MSGQIKELSQTITERLLAENNPQLIGNIAKTLSENLSATQAVVEHAAHLTQSQTQELESRIRAVFPKASDVIFKLSKDLIGGIRITYQDQMYDDSLLGKLETLQNELPEMTNSRSND